MNNQWFSVFKRHSKKTALILVFLISLFNIRSMLIEASLLGGSSDEFVNLNSMINFVESGLFLNKSIHGLQQTQDPFSPYISTGPVALISGILGWKFHNTILYPRLFSVIYAFFITFFFLFLFLKKFFSIDHSLYLSFVFWFIFTTIPDWTFIKSLGEHSGLIWFLFGILAISERKDYGFLLIGVAVWLCKVTYLPAAAILIATLTITRQVNFIKSFLFFLIPFIFWILLILLKTDLNYLREWFYHFILFLIQGPQGVTEEQVSISLLNRLQFNAPFWNNYFRLFFYLSFVSSIYFVTKALIKNEAQSRPVIFSLFVSALFYCLWILLISPVMWPRHVQLGFYFSSCAWFFVFIDWLKKQSSLLISKFVYSAFASISIFILILTSFDTNVARLFFGSTYVRYPFLEYKGLFRNSNIYSDEYHREMLLYKNATQRSCYDLFGKKLNLSAANHTKSICLGLKKQVFLPLTLSEGNRQLRIQSYQILSDLNDNTKAIARFHYDALQNGALRESGHYDVQLKISRDKELDVQECIIQNQASLSNLMIIKTGAVFDICNQNE